jgi:hypothetical protein
MATLHRGLAALLSVALALAWVGCGTASSISDSQIVKSLGLQQTAGGYEIGGDPFCTITDLLNGVDEVQQASDQGGHQFVIASPNGEVGVLAKPPFAPDCTHRARDALKKLARKQG